MNAFKQRCIELRKRDYTLPEIVKITGRPKTSVHFHIQNFPLSEDKLRAIRGANALRARAIGLKRRGLSVKKFRTFIKWDENTVSFVAHFLFDGEIKYSGCFYHNRNQALIKKVEQSVKDFYDFEPKRYKNKLTGVFRICYFNVAFAVYIKEKSEELLRNIRYSPKKLKREFLKSFFDDEGCMDFRPLKNLRRIRGYQKNVSVLHLVQNLLMDFGISSNVKQPNEVVITGKTNLAKFQKEINFSSGVRINGKRSNSIWKKSIEKRELLRRALVSYA